MDFGFLRYFADNLLALTILIIGAIFAIFTWKILPDKLSKLWDKRESAEGNTSQQSVAHFDEMLQRIEQKIDELETRINHVDKNSLVGNIHNTKLHVIDRLRYFDCYLRLGGNSLVEEYAFKTLIQPNPELWYREQQNNMMKAYCGDSYKTRVAEIKRKLQST